MKAFGVVLEHENYETFRGFGPIRANMQSCQLLRPRILPGLFVKPPLKLNLGTRCLQEIIYRNLTEMGAYCFGEESQFICRKTFSGITVDMNHSDTAQTRRLFRFC